MSLLPSVRMLLRGVAFAYSIASAAAAASSAAPARPIPAVEHVVLISIDGLRPDIALRANMPTLRTMLREGAYTFWAKTTEVSITLPSHTSMVTGVTPMKHGVDWNEDLPEGQQRYPRHPTVFQLARQAGYVTAMVAGKSKFTALDQPGAFDHVFVPDRNPGVVSVDTVSSRAAAIIEAHRPALLFIHFSEVDVAGHRGGWGSPAQIAAAERTDAALARVRGALERAGMRDDTVVIVSADHGGTGFSHGPDDARSRHIPWIVTGPGVHPGFDLTRIAELEVHTEDSAATVVYLLGLAQPSYFDGKPVMAAFSTTAPGAPEDRN